MKLVMQTKLEVTQVALDAAEETALANLAVVQGEAEKVAEKEFGADFFQGYSDLKRRVALVHLEWDLTAFSGVELDY